MDWLYPMHAWALAAIPVAIWLYWRVAQWRRAARERFGDARVVRRLAAAVRPGRRILKAGLVVAALLLVAVSLMGPRFGTKVRTVERSGVDLVVALDVSASMRTQDVAPDRFRRAKNEIRDLVGRLSGDRIGLVLFAGEGFVQCPLTTDYSAFRLFLDAARPDQVSVRGTNLEAAVDAAIQAFDAAHQVSDRSRVAASNGDPPPRALLIVSDGENHVGGMEEARQKAEEAGIAIFTAGVGTEKGARIPVYEGEEQVGFQRDRQGTVVRSRLNEDILTRLAQSGAYFRIGSASSALSDVPAALRKVGSSTYSSEQFAEYKQMFQWPLAGALLLLLVEVLIPVRVRTLKLTNLWSRLRTIESPES